MLAQALRLIFRFKKLLLGGLFLSLANQSQAGIHTAPIILPAHLIRAVQYHPISMYRVFRTNDKGDAIAIPFQIDERDHYGDFILPHGKNPNSQFSNGIFDGIDELSIMGNDVGPPVKPIHWKGRRPPIVYEVLFKNAKTKKMGAIYIGAYFSNPPQPSKLGYVSFNLKNAEVKTAKYRYLFNNRNYLVVRGVEILDENRNPTPLLHSSTFYLKTNFKYFLTFEINQKDIESELDAFKIGPIRTIARVNFNYNILKLNFDLGMYTEVSFFSNSVILPAVIDNPLDGPKSLNTDSLFYYGFAVLDDISKLKIESNMPPYRKDSLLDFFRKSDDIKNNYFVSAAGKNYFIYLQMQPSKQMLEDKNAPMFFTDSIPLEELKKRPLDPLPLSESQVNLAVSFKLSNLRKGFHEIALQLFVENNAKPKYLEAYKNLADWRIAINRVRSL